MFTCYFHQNTLSFKELVDAKNCIRQFYTCSLKLFSFNLDALLTFKYLLSKDRCTTMSKSTSRTLRGIPIETVYRQTPSGDHRPIELWLGSNPRATIVITAKSSDEHRDFDTVKRETILYEM
jgi:hypothetical protein